MGGVPAKVIRYRFKEDDIHYLLNSKWWARPEQWIRDNSEAFMDIRQFKELNKIE